ncbi:hypothetical protein GP486_003547 [Trichoglossum hirsutum]|uniref:AAA+ ATPase domain-containing protein n=1 Tax=Trichoglossum hirsutum TaxID=265104 RepID=A0A9P8LCV1_9PEZI|nr:hypothetical protein GP486_003547 [Trichoglossum hirsutum]
MSTKQAFDDLWENALDRYFTSTDRTYSEQTLLNAVSLSPFTPASTILGAVVFLVKAADGVSEAYDWIEQLFDKLGDFTVRLDEYIKGGISALETKVVQILGCLLEILARSEKTIKDGRWKKYAAVLFLGKDEEIKASFEDLAKLFEDEQRLVSAITFATNQRMDKRIEEIEKTGKQMLEAAKRAEIGVDAIQQSQFRDIILNWISPTNFPAQQSDIIDRRQKETGQWFLDAPKFNNWIHGSKQTLFCPGMPGAGKTMMAAIAIDHLSRTIQNDTNGVAYIYCTYKKKREDQNTTILLAAILQQLVQARRPIPEPVSRLHENHSSRGTRPSVDEIFSTLQSILRNYSSVYLVVDTLDECLDKDCTHSQLLTRVRDLQKEANLHLMVTSRSIPEIEEEIKEKFKQAIRLEVRASDEDVKRFVMGQMCLLPKFIRSDDELQRLVKDKIVEAADGMFLLARLHIDLLQGKTTKKQVKLALEKVSKRFQGSEELVQVYDQAYDEAIKRIESQSHEKSALARNVLSWITYAQRQLTTGELCHALAIELGEEDLDEDNVPDVEDIVSVCAGLVTVDEVSNIIRLVHYTTQEYFERIRKKNWNPHAELKIASACLKYLSFHPFRSGSCPSDKEFESRLEQNAFLDYASRYWGWHAQAVTVQEQVFEVASLFLQDGNLVSCAVQTMSMSEYKYGNYSQAFPRQATSVHLTARFGLLYLSERLLSQPNGNIGISADSKDSYGLTPLSWAAGNGHEAVVKLLLAKGAEKSQ